MASTTKKATPNADEAIILTQWREKTVAAAEALNLTTEQVNTFEHMSEDELIAGLLYKRNQSGEE